jgi:zinc protease
MKTHAKSFRAALRWSVLALGTVILLFVWRPILFGQDSVETAPTKVERKNKAPVSRSILQVKLPKPKEAKLSNGLTVLILEDHRTPFISMQLHVNGAGALFEPANQLGLANATAQMLREGTRARTSREIAETIDGLGAILSAGSSFGSPDAVLSGSGLSENFDAWFGVAVDVLLRPSFPADELEKFKQRQRAQLRQQRSAASFLISERFNRAVYGDHPGAIVAPTLESLDALTASVLAQWHRDRFAPQNSILGVAGDVRAAELMPKLRSWLSAWRRSEVREVWPPNPSAANARKVYLVDRPGSVQTTVAMGNIAIDRRSPDYLPMVVMNHVIGGGASARLFLNLREEKGYTYGVYSDFNALHYPGPWRAGGNMRTEVTEGALVEFFNEIRRLREEEVPGWELEASKRAIASRFALSLEQPSAILGLAITQKQYRLPSDYWDTYATKIMTVTAADVQRVARKYLNPDTSQLVAVGDAGKLRDVLEKYGAVEIYDSEGRRVPPL